MLSELTEDQIKALSKYRDKWLNKIFNYELHDTKTFYDVQKSMTELYKFCNLPKPYVLLVDSPMACQIAANIFNQVSLHVGNQVRNQVSLHVGDQAWNQVSLHVGDQANNQVGLQVIDQVSLHVGDQVRNQVGDQVGEHDEKLFYYAFSNYINYSDFGWLSNFDFYANETNIIDDHKDKLNKIIDFVDHSFMSIQLNNLCIVSKYPAKICRNQLNQLHNLDDYAISFDDGYGQHYINGLFINPKLFHKLKNKTYTFEDWMSEPNEEIKSIVLAYFTEKYGNEFTYRFLSDFLREIDTYVDKKNKQYLKGTVESMNIGVYTLFKGIINNTEIAYVRCFCPSTDRMFFLGVDPENNNAKDAIASLCQIPYMLKDEIVSIARQGEIFSFNLTDKGLKIIDYMTSEDYSDVISLSGDEYFSKMKFEY